MLNCGRGEGPAGDMHPGLSIGKGVAVEVIIVYEDLQEVDWCATFITHNLLFTGKFEKDNRSV